MTEPTNQMTLILTIYQLTIEIIYFQFYAYFTKLIDKLFIIQQYVLLRVFGGAECHLLPGWDWNAWASFYQVQGGL